MTRRWWTGSCSAGTESGRSAPRNRGSAGDRRRLRSWIAPNTSSVFSGNIIHGGGALRRPRSWPARRWTCGLASCRLSTCAASSRMSVTDAERCAKNAAASAGSSRQSDVSFAASGLPERRHWTGCPAWFNPTEHDRPTQAVHHGFRDGRDRAREQHRCVCFLRRLTMCR